MNETKGNGVVIKLLGIQEQSIQRLKWIAAETTLMYRYCEQLRYVQCSNIVNGTRFILSIQACFCFHILDRSSK